MKKAVWIILFLSLTLLIIGIDQALVKGLQNSYWIFMFSLALLFIFWYLKGPKTSGNKNE
jgi:hypothetical protein